MLRSIVEVRSIVVFDDQNVLSRQFSRACILASMGTPARTCGLSDADAPVDFPDKGVERSLQLPIGIGQPKTLTQVGNAVEVHLERVFVVDRAPAVDVVFRVRHFPEIILEPGG